MLKNIISSSISSKLQESIQTSSQIVITCHVSPDGDALGSSLALFQYLLRIGKNVSLVVPSPFPAFLLWLPGASDVIIFNENKEYSENLVKKSDTIFCMDFNASSRLEGLSDSVLSSTACKIMLDHHPNPESFCSLTISEPSASSTSELLFSIFYQLGIAKTLTKEEATCIYTGMMTDTGGFTYNSSKSEIYFIIGELLSCGIDKDKIYRNVFYNYAESRFRLMGFLLYQKMQYLSEYRTSLMTLTLVEQDQFLYEKGDTEGVVNIPLQIKGTRLSIFMRENIEKKDSIRMSLRSVDNFPCNKIAAEYFNGGGHLNAAGGELFCSMDEAIEVVHTALNAYKDFLLVD